MENYSHDVILYLNIPFCIQQPHYDRRHHMTGSSAAKAEYLEALEKELLAAAEDLGDTTVQAVYVGGGSPSIMSADGLGRLLLSIRRNFHLSPQCEVSLEAIPNTVGVPSLTGWGCGKPNRINLNIQSINPHELTVLGCPFDVSHIQNAVLYLDKFHLNNVNVNLVYGIPGQTRVTWKQTLRSTLDLEPFHITISPLPAAGNDTADEDEQFEWYQMACEYLSENGYRQYSVNQFTSNQSVSRYHYHKYMGCPVLGFGLDARSAYDGYVYANTSDYRNYILHSEEPEHIITNPQEMNPQYLTDRFLYHRLCLLSGFDEEDYRTRFGAGLPDDAKEKLALWQEQKLLEQVGNGFRLTPLGMFRWKRIRL